MAISRISEIKYAKNGGEITQAKISKEISAKAQEMA